MTTLSLDTFPLPSRHRLAARRSASIPAGAVLAVAPVVDSSVILTPPAALGNDRQARHLWPLVALVIVGHGALLYAFNHQKATAPVVPVKTPPISIAVVTPPKPLAQVVTPPAPAKPVEPPKPVQAPKTVVHRTITPKAVAPARPAPDLPVVTPSPAADSAPAPVAVAAPPAPAAPAAPAPKLVGPIGNAAYLHNPPPNYPELARDEGLEGRVILKVHVLANGQPDSVDVLTSSGHGALDRAAMTAVRKWTFVPAKRGDVPEDGWVNVPLDFKLG